MKGQKVLVTGGAGFIGGKLADRLRGLGSDVVVFDLCNGQDVTKYGDLEALASGRFDLVCHLAGKLYIPDSWKNPRDYYEVNTLGTLNVLDFCRKHGVPKIVFVSTYVYGQPQYLPIDEAHPPAADNPYARSKLLAEELCRAYHEHFNIDCVVLRPFNVYGAGQTEAFLIPKIISAALKGEEITLFDAKPKRDFLYINDLIEAFVKAVRYSGAGFDIFNIGSGQSFRIGEIIETVAACLGREVKVKYLDQVRRNEIPETLADNTRARKLLEWTPSFNLEAGLKEIIGGALKCT